MHANKHSRTRAEAHVTAALNVLAIGGALVLSLGILFGIPFHKHISLDKRSLAVGRMMLGFLVVMDLVKSRWKFRTLLYSDKGMWPRSLVLAGCDPRISCQSDFSLYMCFGSPAWTSFAFMLAGISGVCAAIGFYTHLSLFGCWLHLYSLSRRCSGCQQAGDTFFQLLMFWSMFLPCEDVWSIDSLRISVDKTDSLFDNGVTSLACVGLLSQIGMIYAFCAMFKITPSWKDGTAIDKVLKNFAFSRSLKSSVKLNIVVNLLHKFPFLPRLLTSLTVFVEHSAVLFLFCWPLRGIGCAIFCSFHFGLYSSMRLGIFPLVCITAWVLVLPGYFWEAIRFTGNVVINADGECKHSEIQTSVGEINGTMSFTWSLLFFMITWLLSFVTIGIQLTALALSLACNLNTLPFESCAKIVTKDMYAIARLLGVQQQWFLFDKPAKNSFWFRIVGEISASNHKSSTAEPTKVDLHRFMLGLQNDSWLSAVLSQGQSTKCASKEYLNYCPYDSPKHRAWEDCYGSHRWRKLFQKLTDSKKRFVAFRQPYARFLQSEWDDKMVKRGFGRLQKVTMVGCAIPIDPVRSLSDWESCTETNWKPMRKVAWEVELQEDSDITNRKLQKTQKQKQRQKQKHKQMQEQSQHA